MALRAPSRLAMAVPKPLALPRRAPIRPLTPYRLGSQLAPVSRRQLVPLATALLLPKTLRRDYANGPVAAPVKKKGRGFFGWAWLLTKLGALGGAVWVGYAIWAVRQPDEQFDPDPSKKTLVILGNAPRPGRSSARHSSPAPDACD